MTRHTPAATLAALQELHTEQRWLTQAIAAQVTTCRKAGATWPQIAQVLGVTPQAVQQRYHTPTLWPRKQRPRAEA